MHTHWVTITYIWGRTVQTRTVCLNLETIDGLGEDTPEADVKKEALLVMMDTSPDDVPQIVHWDIQTWRSIYGPLTE